MITVISRFRVLNGMEEVVRHAFACRPHLVNCAPGFNDFSVVTDAADPAIFFLITGWLDVDHPSLKAGNCTRNIERSVCRTPGVGQLEAPVFSARLYKMSDSSTCTYLTRMNLERN
jgi:hypothetical protein